MKITAQKHLILLALAVIAVFSFFARASSLSEVYVNADDPYLVYRLSYYFVDNLSLPANDTLRLYPYGWQYYATRDHLLWYYTAGIIAFIFAKVLSLPNAISLAVHFYPPFFAFLMTFVVFFLTKEIFRDWKPAIIAALIFAGMPAIIYRTNSSFADKEPIASFFMLLSYYFYVKAINTKDKRGYYFSFLSGLLLALMAMTWGGAELVITSYTFFAFTLLLFNLFNKDLALKHAITSLTAYLLVIITPAGYFKWFAPNNLLNYAIIASSLIASFKPLKFRMMKNTYLTTFLLLLVLMTPLLFYQPVQKQLYNLMARIRAPLAESGVIASTVAENRPSSYIELASQTGPGTALFLLSLPQDLALVTNMFFISVISALLLAYKISEKMNLSILFLLVWFSVFIWAGIGAVRLIYIAGFPITVVASYLLSSMLDYTPKSISKKYKTAFKIALISITLFIIFINAISGYAFGQSLRPGMSKNWEEALLWIKENSNETDVILSWWDYGYIIQFYAERPTYVDPGHPSWLFGKDITLPEGINSRDKQVAMFFTSTNESEYIDWLRSINVRYVVHDISMIGKYSAVSTIASDGQFVDIIQIYPYQGSICVEQVNNTCVKIVHKYGPIWLVVTNNSIQPVYVFQGFPTNISKVCTVTNVFVVDPNGMPGCVYLGDGAVAFTGIRCSDTGCQPYDLSDTIFVRMWFMDANGLQHFRKVYDNGEVKIFEVIY